MTARVNIEPEAWTDLRFATLARLCGLADHEHALIRVAKIWVWQTEHYTPQRPTYVVDRDLVDTVLGEGGADRLVRAQLAEEVPEGFRMKGTEGRIEWLSRLRQNSAAGGEATKRKRANKSEPIGPPAGEPDVSRAASPTPSPLTPSPVLPDRESLSPDPDSSSPEPPDPVAIVRAESRARARSAPVPRATAPVPAATPATSAWQGRQGWWQAMRAAHDRLRAEGIEPNALDFAGAAAGPHDTNLAACARMFADGYGPDAVDAKMLHVVAVAETEARREVSLKWFKPSLIWEPARAARAADTSLAEAARARGAPARGPTQIAMDELARLEREAEAS